MKIRVIIRFKENIAYFCAKLKNYESRTICEH